MTKEKYVSYKIDKKVKEEAEKIIRKLGFSPSSLITIFYEKIIEEEKIPFDISQYHKNKKIGYMCRIEKKVKEEAEKIIKTAGLMPSSLITMFYNEIIKQEGIPFEVKIRLNEEKK